MYNSVLILERSSQNLQKVAKGNKTVLEGVFAEFGIENKNSRIYQEAQYLPHIEYLKKDIANGNLLGELDHPERFEVQLSNVSHRVTDLWYDAPKRQILGRIEILDGTPKGQIAKSLLEAGVPLSISSRAAGTVNDDKTVSIQQIYTYDLVAKPGFEAAQLHNVNESYRSNIQNLINRLNESYNTQEKQNIGSDLGIVNENISIIDVTDKYPSVKFREEAKILNKNNNKNNENNMDSKLNEDAIQQWTIQFKSELSKLNERLNQFESKILENGGTTGDSKEIKLIKSYVEKLRSIQENSLNWQSDIAKAVNKVASYTDNLAKKSNEHYDLTQKLVETVDYNAKTLNHTQDWVGSIATTTNAIGESVDHNATMLNGVNEWNTQISKAVNKMHEWGEEKATAINDMHDWVSDQARAINGINEWTSSVAKNLNHSVNWTEDMFGKAISKDDAKRLVEYIELVSESKQDPELKARIEEMLSKNNINEKPLSEGSFKGIEILDCVEKIDVTKNVDAKGMTKGVEFDDKTKTIVAKMKEIKLKKEGLPKGLKTLGPDDRDSKLSVSGKVKGIMVIDTTKTIGSGEKTTGSDGPKNVKNQNLKLDVKGKKNMNESYGDNSDKTLQLDDFLNDDVNGCMIMQIDYKEAKIIMNTLKDKGLHILDINASLSTPDDFELPVVNNKLQAKDINKYDYDSYDIIVFNEVSKAGSSTQNYILKLILKNRYKILILDQNTEDISNVIKNRSKMNESLNIDRTKTIKTRSTNLDEKLSKIISTLEKERGLDEQIKSKYPFTTLLSEGDRKRFDALDATDKEKVNSEINKVPTIDPKVITKIWESTLNEKANAQPLWLRCAPEKYKTVFEGASQAVKDSIAAKAEYFDLNNQYAIDNFWETSGLVKKQSITLNESVLAKTPEESKQKFDSFVNQVGEMMKKYNN